jgi:hypothetical protein
VSTWFIDHPERLALEGDVTHVEVWFAHGRLNVVGTDGPPRVEITRVGRKGLTVRHEGGVLSIRHDIGRRFWTVWTGPTFWFRGRRNYQADVSVAVPRNTSASLGLVSGSVVASGIAGGATVDVTSGSITLMGVDGSVRAKTVSGSIEALGVGGDGGRGGGDLTAETISGEITIADSSAQRVLARTLSGAITCDLDNPRASDIRLDTTSGEITVRVPEDADLVVNLSATSGGITSAFPQVRPGGLPGMRSAQGQLGVGTGALHAYAISGNVNLLARPVGDDHDGDGAQDPTSGEANS